jgi:hypothetical protein
MGHHYTRHPANVDERDKGGIQMRSKLNQLPGIALVAVLGVSLLSGCAVGAASAEDFDSSKVSCGAVAEQLKDAKADLKEAKATLADAKDTPDEAIASDDVTAAEAKVTALKERSKECADEAKAEAEVEEDAAALAQCRVDALMAYMLAQGFKEDEYIIGEERVDFENPAVLETGSLAFGVNGANVTSRDDLQDVFESKEESHLLVIKSVTDKFPSVKRSVLLDAQNWEVVQTLVDTMLLGNRGYLNGQATTLGDRDSDGGDAGWIFVDPETCTVPFAEGTTPEQIESGDGPVGLVRVGCINPGNGLKPKNPKLDILVNDQLPEFYAEDGEGHTATTDNYQGNLADVLAEQERKRKEAEAAQAAKDKIAADAAAAAEAAAKEEPATGEQAQLGW